MPTDIDVKLGWMNTHVEPDAKLSLVKLSKWLVHCHEVILFGVIICTLGKSKPL